MPARRRRKGLDYDAAKDADITEENSHSHTTVPLLGRLVFTDLQFNLLLVRTRVSPGIRQVFRS